MGSQTVSFAANGTLKMDLKDQGNSINWISLINTVFASIAVLPVFLVWFLGIITDSIEEKETQEDKVIIIEDNKARIRRIRRWRWPSLSTGRPTVTSSNI